MRILIREFEINETEALISLFRNTVRVINAQDYNSNQILAWAPDHIDCAPMKQRLANSFTIVAEVNRKTAGFANLEPSGHIDMFFVSAEFQRQGIGAALMTNILEKARASQMKQITADVSITARTFFEKIGFELQSEQHVEIRGEVLKNFKMSFEVR